MGIQINGNTNNINAGIGSLSIEDINELDIVGVATAANFKTGVSNLHSVGLSLSGGQIDVGSNIKIGNAGVITATSFVGSGANLTGITVPGGGTGLDVNDNVRIRLGNSNDLQIWHNGSESYISEAGTGGLTMYADHLKLENPGGEKMIYATSNAAVELYHNNTKRLETFENSPFVGISVTNDVVLNGSSDTAYRWAIGGNAVSNFKWSMYYSNSGSSLNIFDNVNSRNMASFKETGVIELNYGSSKKFETTSDGVKITGDLRFDSPPTKAMSLPDDKRIYFGNSDDLVIWHSPNNNSYIKNITGELFLASDNIALKTSDQSETFIDCNGNGNVELYHDNTKQCETSANGLAFPSGKGIDFSADGSGTLKTLPNSFNAEVLHDYEVGTFVPNIQYDTGTNHYYGSVGSGQNVASAKGEYIRIGDLVSFGGEITLTGNRNYTQYVHISIGGMPYNGLHSSQQSSLMTGWGGAAWPKNDSNASYRLIYAWHAYTTLNFYFYQASGNNGIDGFRFWGFYRTAP